MKKQILSILLAALIVISVVPLTAFAEDGVPYLDENGNTQTADNVTEIKEGYYNTREYTSGFGYRSGWYILKSNKSLGSIWFIGETHLILADNATITLSGIRLEGQNASITIYAQSTGNAMGKLMVDASSDDFNAGIGSSYGSSCGNITIIGGDITAKGGLFAAGIGSGHEGKCGNITINRSATRIAAQGGQNAQNIGCGVGGGCGNISYIGSDQGQGTTLSGGDIRIIVAIAGIAVIATVIWVLAKKKKAN